ncbi:hypothetical protein [Aquamicrobium terrae]
MTSNIAGGCDFPADPGFSALDQSVIWSPVANPDMLMLGAAPDFLPPSPSALSVDLADAICGPEGTYGVCDASDGVQYLILADTDANSQPAIICHLTKICRIGSKPFSGSGTCWPGNPRAATPG